MIFFCMSPIIFNIWVMFLDLWQADSWTEQYRSWIFKILSVPLFTFSTDRVWRNSITTLSLTWSQNSTTTCKMRRKLEGFFFSYQYCHSSVPELFSSFPSVPAVFCTEPCHLIQLARRPFWNAYRHWEYNP